MFANVPIHLTSQTRQLVQRELQHLYVSPRQCREELEALRRLAPLLKPFLQKASLPDDFCLLALPFSDTDTLGYWALSAQQAQQLNLHLNRWVAEQYHPLITTEAVVAKMHHWQQPQANVLLTLLRYLEWAARDPRQQAINRYYIQPDEQSPVVLWKLLARKVAMTAQSLTQPMNADSIYYVYQPTGEQTLAATTERLPVTLNQLKVANRWLKTDSIPAGRDYTILVPLTPDGYLQASKMAESGHHAQALVTSEFPILVKATKETDPLRATAHYYQINQRWGVQAQNCDNLITLAFYGQLSIQNFLKYNDLPDEKVVIQPGQVYYLEAKGRRAKVPYHVVQPNQTLAEIANLYGIRLKSLMGFNRLQAVQRLPTGRVLWLQKKRPANQLPAYVELPKPLPPSLPQPILKTDSATIVSTPSPTGVSPVLTDSLPHALGDSLMAGKKLPVPATLQKDTIRPSAIAVTNKPQPIQWHVVKAGQTYYGIARLRGVSVEQLYRWNRLSAAIPLRVGQSLRIQRSAPLPTAMARRVVRKPFTRQLPTTNGLGRSATMLKRAMLYTVHAGQTLYRIAVEHRVRVKDLVSWNSLKSVGVEVGQILVIWH